MLGKPVPDFSLPSTGNNSPFSLSSARGRDNTESKTSIGDPYKGFKRARCEIYGVSRVREKSPRHRAQHLRGRRGGGLAREWRGVKVPGHVQEVLSFVKAL